MQNNCKSARRDSNPRPRPWQGRTPPTEPLAHISYSFLRVTIYSQNYTLNLHPFVTLFFAVIHRPSVYFITLALPMFQSFQISPYESKLSTAFSFNPEPLPKPYWLSPRPISNSQLHVLPHFHLCPIYLVVFKGSYSCDGITHLEGGFTLRCLQRLSLPDLATRP